MTLPEVTATIITVSLGVAFFIVHSRLYTAVKAQAEALGTFGLRGVLSQENRASIGVHCRGCGALAGSGELYCFRCGQSLIGESE